jgi:hypothetical protein
MNKDLPTTRISYSGLREFPPKGEATILVIYHADDGEILTFHAKIDRWNCTSILSHGTVVVDRLVPQMKHVMNLFADAIHKRYGLGSMSFTPDQ